MLQKGGLCAIKEHLGHNVFVFGQDLLLKTFS